MPAAPEPARKSLLRTPLEPGGSRRWFARSTTSRPGRGNKWRSPSSRDCQANWIRQISRDRFRVRVTVSARESKLAGHRLRLPVCKRALKLNAETGPLCEPPTLGASFGLAATIEDDEGDRAGCDRGTDRAVHCQLGCDSASELPLAAIVRGRARWPNRLCWLPSENSYKCRLSRPRALR